MANRTVVLSTHARRLFCVLGSAHSLMKGGEPARGIRETPANSFHSSRRRSGRLHAQAASEQPHCAFLAFTRIRLATAPRCMKAINRRLPVIQLVKLLTALVGLAAAIAGTLSARRRNVPYKQAKSHKRKR